MSLVNGERLEVDHPDALVARDGVAIFVGPGGIPAIFDHEGVAQTIGDLATQEIEFLDQPNSRAVIKSRVTLKLLHSGTYWLDVTFDGRQLTRMALELLIHRG